MHRKELDYMNAFACICVVLIHVLSLGISSAERMSWQAAVIYFPWRLSAYVVPMFLYTGAVKMADNMANKKITVGSWGKYFLGRIKKIYIPYIIWTAIYFLCFLRIGYVKGEAGEFLNYLWFGSITSPFYYIIIVMQFYLLMPLWMWLVKHIPAYMGILISLLVTVCMQQFPTLLGNYGIEFAWTDRIFPTYLIFWVVGLYVGKSYDRAKNTMENTSVLSRTICAVVIVLCAFLAYLSYSGRYCPFNLNDVKIIADLLSIAFLHTLCISLTSANEKIQRLLGNISKSSFFVYLCHCLFLTLAMDFLQRHGVGGLTVLLVLRFVVCYTIPFILYFIYNRTLNRVKLLKGILG